MEHHELGKLYRVPLLVNGTLIGPIGPNTFKRRRPVGPTATTTTPVAPKAEKDHSNPTHHKWRSMKKALVFLTMLGEERRSAHNGTAAEA